MKGHSRAPAVTNGLWSALANGVSTLLAIAGSVLIVRSLTPESYGAFSYYVWLATILSVLGTLALPIAVTKVASELRGGGMQAQALALSKLVTIGILAINLLLAAVLLLIALQASDPQRLYLLIIAAYLLPHGLSAALRSVLWGHERYRPVAISEITSACLQIVLVVLAYLGGWGVPGYVVAVLSGYAVQAGLLVGVLVLRPIRAPEDSQPPALQLTPVVRRYINFAAPATIIFLADVIVWQRSEIFFLEIFQDLAQVGYYNLSYTIFGAVLVLGWALIQGFYPAMSRDYGSGQWEPIREKLRQGIILGAIFAVPITFGGWAILGEFIVLVYGEKMTPSIPVAQILLLSLLPGVTAGVVALMINAVGGIWLLVRLGVLMVALNIALNLALIPSLAAPGAALANAATHITNLVIILAVVSRRYQMSVPYRPVLALIAVGAVTTFAGPWLLQSMVPGLIGLTSAVVAGACMYFAAIWGLGYMKLFRIAQAAP